LCTSHTVTRSILFGHKLKMPGILRPHPQPPAAVAAILAGVDSQTSSKRQHRQLTEKPGRRADAIEWLRAALVRHHAGAEKRQRLQEMNQALQRQGFPPRSVYPVNQNTRKGNLAEVVLAEYVVASEELSLPVYRLRYNPNVDQSMKGDDVLAFDLGSSPMRILVGESKFRATPRREHVEEIVAGLLRSHHAQIPVSLQFVADRLYDSNNEELGRRIQDCQIAIIRGQIDVDYVGFLLGPVATASCVGTHTPGGTPVRLAMISLCVDSPDDLVDDCYRNLV